MRIIRMLGRLLWKEARESWVIIAIAVLVPTLTFKLASGFERPEMRGVLQFIGVVCSLASIILWGVLKGERVRNESKMPLAHLPASLILERAVSLGLPLIVCMFAGAWFGRVAAIDGVFGLEKSDAALAERMLAMYGAFAFAGCCFLSAAISTWTAIGLGIVWMFFGSLAMQGIRVPSFQYGAWPYLVRGCVASIFSLALFLVLSHRRMLRFAWAPPLLILVMVMLGSLIRELMTMPYGHTPKYANVVISTDGAVEAGQVSYGHGSSVIFYSNRATGKMANKSFGGIATPVAVDNDGCVYLAQWTNGRDIRTIAWDGKTTRRIAGIPGGPSILDRFHDNWQPFNSVSPDRRYVLFSTGSELGRGADIWVVDTRSRKAWIILPNHLAHVERVSWMGDHLAVSGCSPQISVADLRTRKTSVMRIPSGDGG